MDINYPIDYTLYSIDEITIIINFLNTVEECYHKGVPLAKYKEQYKSFKQVVRAKSEENNLLKEFNKITGYDGYLTTQEMKKEVAIIKMK